MPKAKWEIVADFIYSNFNFEDNITKEQVENIFNSQIRGNTWNALFSHEILMNKDGLNYLLPKKEKAKKTSSKKKTSSTSTSDSTLVLKISKADNQYYAQYIEEAVTAIINGDPIPNNVKNYTFEQWEIDIMNEDAKEIASYLNGSSANYVGRQTSNQSCDVIVDGKEIEIKYSKNNGTYHNGSITYFDQFGLIPFKQYMMDYGVLDFLAETAGDKVYKNISPMGQEEASAWKETYPEKYKQLQVIEKKARTAYVDQVFNYLTENPARIENFARQMLSKESSGKHTPDSIIIYHHNTDEIVEFTKEEIMAMVNSSFTRRGCFTFKFKGFHTTIAWQNNTGLCNPTIRVYLDKKER